MKTYYVTLISCFLILSYGGNCFAQISSTALFNQLQSKLDSRTAFTGIEGTGALLILDNGESWNGTAGVADFGRSTDTTHYWHWASVTKSMTATIIFQLQEEGKLSLSDPISMYMGTDTIPYLDSSNVPLTITSLLSHTTDIVDPFYRGGPLDSAIFSDRARMWKTWEVLQYIDSIDQSHVQGQHKYKPFINYLLLEFVIEEATGNDIKTEFQNRIFGPLGMNNSKLGFDTIPTSMMNGVWKGNQSMNDSSQNAYLSSIGIGANYVGTTRDVVKFMRALMQGQLLSSSSMLSMKQITSGSSVTYPLPACGTIVPITFEYGKGLTIPKYDFGNNDIIELHGHSGDGNSQSSVYHHLDSNWTLAMVGNDFTLPGNSAQIFIELLCIIKNNWVTSLSSATSLGIKYYPNPAHEKLIINKGQNSIESVEIINTLGHSVFKKEGDIKQIDTSNYPEGTYLVKVRTKSGKGIQRIQILH